jgi:hypothetical protein
VPTLRNDKRVASTYLDHTHNEEGGRFAKPQQVIGTTAPEYPAGPNWAADPVGVEPPLGFSVEDHEPVGEYAEVAKSLGDATTEASSSNVDVAAQFRLGASPSEDLGAPAAGLPAAPASAQGEPATRAPQSGSPPKPRRGLR